MHGRRLLLLLVVVGLGGTAATGQTRWEPQLGYVYPAGARRGSITEVILGGQVLHNPTAAYVTGEGVQAVVIKHYRPNDNLDGDQRRELQRIMRDLRERQLAELTRKGRMPKIPEWILNQWRRGPAARPENEPEPVGPIELPEHPLLRDLERKNLRELQEVENTFLNWQYLSRRQPNSQLRDMVLLMIVVDRDAPPGPRELRLASPLGLSNPVTFCISGLPELREQEPNDPEEFTYLPEAAPYHLPAVINGRIMPGDVDRLRFHAKEGQNLVIDVQARQLVPFLADAVPGWFQPVAALYDPAGQRVAYSDDNAFRPDPVIHYEVPADGIYELEIRDAIYRGRQDFVYRVEIGELPFITSIFPLGAQAGEKVSAAVRGWNLPFEDLPLPTQPDGPVVRQALFEESPLVDASVRYAVDPLPALIETEGGDAEQAGQRVELPVIVDGYIGRPGEVDTFRFDGVGGQELVVEVMARRLGSPLDSVVYLADARGEVVAWNDDHMVREGVLHPDMGTVTHHADSYLTAELPASGEYLVKVGDVQGGGSEAHAYRLRLGFPRPDFRLCTTPSSLSMLYGRVTQLTVHALRKEGFDGEIRVSLAGDPAGCTLSGGVIPAGVSSVMMTLRGPTEPTPEPVGLRLEGTAIIDGQPVTRPVTPAEDMTQAFLWRHLVPSEELLLQVRPSQWGPIVIEPASDGPVPIPAGGTATVRYKSPGWRVPLVEMKVIEPTDGLAITGFESAADFITCTVQAGGEGLKSGNLVVEGIVVWQRSEEDRKKNPDAPEPQPSSIGILPAVPYRVVRP